MARTNIAALSATLSLNAAQFRKGLGESHKRLQTFSKQAAVISGAVAGAMAAIASSILSGISRVIRAAWRNTIGAVQESFRNLDELAKRSKRLGFDPQALAGLQLGAKLAGIEFNTFTMAIQRMQRRVAEAAVGMGEAQGALKELGIDARELSRLRPEQALFRILEALERFPQGDRLRLAFKLFDSEGVAILQASASDMRKAMEDFERLHGPITPSQLRRIEEANDAVTRMGVALRGMADSLAIAIAPIVEAVANWVSQVVMDVREIMAAFDPFIGFRRFGAGPFRDFSVAGGSSNPISLIRSIDDNTKRMLDQLTQMAAPLVQLQRDSQVLAQYGGIR